MSSPSGQSGSYLGRSAAERAAERRSRLLEATLSVWSASAGSRVTMTRICAEAGLTERYFYESFSGLDEALTAVMDDLATEIEDVAYGALDTVGSDPAARVRASLLAFVELIAADPRKGRVAIIEAAALPSLRQRRTQLLRHFAQRSAEEVGGLRGLPDPGPRGLEMAGLLFVGGMAELVTAWLDDTLSATPAEIADAATAMFLGMLR